VTHPKTKNVNGKRLVVGWDQINASQVQLIVGAENSENVTDGQEVGVEQVIVHEQFTGEGDKGHNIALLKLARPWSGPVALLSPDSAGDPPGMSDKPNGKMLGVVTGYGMSAAEFANLKQRQIHQIHLREVIIPFVQQAKCVARYAGNVGDGDVCAGFERGGANACSGFSGGPLSALTDEGCPYVVGIVSWGHGCGLPSDYGVYTRVSYYKNWLQSHIPEIKFVDGRMTSRERPLSEAWKAVLGTAAK
jgi:secreted trypsin-like serine protease